MSGKTSVLPIMGWGLTAFGALGFFSVLTKKNPNLRGFLFSLLFLAGGIALLSIASKIKKRAAKYRNYIDIVVNMGEKSIDNVAGAFALPYDVVLKDLQDMIDTGYLKDAYIHQANREIILKQAVEMNNNSSQTQSQTAGPSKTVLRCPACGANNVATAGQIAECEYCGTPINS